MSTSDAGELELGVVGGETATPLSTTETRTQTARELQNETSAIYFEQVPFCEDGASHSFIRPNRTHTAVTHSLRKDNTAFCCDSEVWTENPVRPKFTSSFFLKLSSRPGLSKSELNLHKETDPWKKSLDGLSRVSSVDVIYRVNGQTSYTVDKKIPLPSTSVRKEEETQYHNDIRPCSEPGDIQTFSKGHCGPFRKNEVDISQRGLLPKRTDSRLVELEVDQTKHTNLNRLQKLSGHSTMLSSTVVTVLAPQWSGRLRRNKREGNGNSDFQGNLQDGSERMFTGGLQSQQHTPFVSTRSNTVGWSSKSGPTSLSYESQRKVPHSVSLDVISLRTNDKKTDVPMSSPRSPLSPRSPRSPVSPMSVDSIEPQRSPQRGLSTSSSKPTTSSMLLSLRRFNNNSRSSNESQTLGNPDSLQNNRQFSTQYTQAFQHKNELSPTSISNTANSNEPLSPSPSFRERDITKTYNFSTSPSKHTDTPFSQANATCPELLTPQRSFSRESSDSIKLTKKPVTLPKRTPYDHTALLKTHSVPRRTPLSSISWLPHDNQDSSCQISSNERGDINNKPNTPITAPFNNNNSPADNGGFNGQYYRDNNNTAECVGKGNMNLDAKAQGGTYNTEDCPNNQSLVKGRLVDSCLNRVPPKPQSLPGVFCNSKFSRAAPHTALSHTKGLTECDASHGSFTAKVTELPPTLSSPKSLYTPTDSSSKYQNIYCAPKMNNTSSVLQNKDPQKFTKQSHLLDITNTVTNAAPNKSGLGLAQNNKTSFQYSPVSTQASIHVSTHTSSPAQTLPPKFPNSTPLGFERSYVSVPKPSQAKTVSNLNPTVSLYSKTNHSPTFTTDASSPSFLSPHSPPVSVSSLLTPPSTPSFTSPSSTETSPKDNKTFTNISETDPKKQCPRYSIKRVRRVTFEDSVDSNTEEKPDPTNTPSQRNVKAPAIFSFLRTINPTPNASPRFSPTPKSSSIQAGAGGRYRSLSSDSAELKSRETYTQTSVDALTFDRKKQDLSTPRQERTLSVESVTNQYRSAAPLSLPPDFSHGYKHRYSSPPYSTLVSSRSAQAETKTKPPRSPLFQRPSQPMHTNPIVDMNSTISKHPLLLNSPLPLRPLPPQTALQESLNCKDILSDQVNNNPINTNTQVTANGQILLVDNRVHISSQSLPGDRSHRSSSTCVTETLVYSIRAKTDKAEEGPKNTTPKPVQHTLNTPVPQETQISQQWQVQRKEHLREQDNQSNQSSSGSSSTESQTNEDDNCKRKIKEVGKSRFYSVESNNEQSPKRSRFALKKSSGTSSSSLSRSESERANKTNNKMDQVLSKLKQTFRRSSEEDVSFPWKWKKTSQAPSVSGMSDVSSTSDVTVETNRTVEETREEATMELNNNEKGIEDQHRWTSNRYTLIPVSAERNKMAEDKLSVWTDEVMTDTENDEQAAEHELVKIHSPIQQLDLNNETFDFKPSNQFLSPKKLSPAVSPNSSAFPSTQFRKSPSSPRSPFSPFSSLSPLSPFSPPDSQEDSVFYSPKLQRHRDSSSSPCELGEISLVATRRSRASTGPPSSGPGPNKERMSNSYADLKYGIEPGKSFSVSSVLSSRPSGPGRISTGSRFMSVGDLSKTAFSCGHTVNDSDNWSTQYGCQPPFDSQAEYFLSDSGKARSRSLPRSLTRCLTNWGTVKSPSLSVPSTSNPTWSANINDLPWDTEGPPTPPPTPPLSPVLRRISKPPCLSAPTFTGSSEPPQDCQSPRGQLPSRQYTSSLSTFEESSDSSSDTTTDDEYYLETGDDEEKETEL